MQSVIRLTRDFMHDSLSLTCSCRYMNLLVKSNLSDNQLEYDVRDDIMVKDGLVLCQSCCFQPFQDVNDDERM